MKYCSKCGKELFDEAIICPGCGCYATPTPSTFTQKYETPHSPPKMNNCKNCNLVLPEGMVICPICGNYTQTIATPAAKSKSNLKTAAKVLMIISTVILGLYIIPLAWCLPMTIIYCNKVNNNKPIGTGFKICSLIFVSLVGGILMLCDEE